MEKNEKTFTEISVKEILIDNKIIHANKGEISGQLQSEHFCGCCKTIKGKFKGFVLHLNLKTPGSQNIYYKKLLAAPLVNGHNYSSKYLCINVKTVWRHKINFQQFLQKSVDLSFDSRTINNFKTT